MQLSNLSCCCLGDSSMPHLNECAALHPTSAFALTYTLSSGKSDCLVVSELFVRTIQGPNQSKAPHLLGSVVQELLQGIGSLGSSSSSRHWTSALGSSSSSSSRPRFLLESAGGPARFGRPHLGLDRIVIRPHNPLELDHQLIHCTKRAAYSGQSSSQEAPEE